MKRIKGNNNSCRGKNKYRKLQFRLSCVLFVVLVFSLYQGFVFYQFNLENDKLISLKNDYDKLMEEIERYKILKGQYEVVLNESNDLISDKKMLEKKIGELNNDINSLENKINDINKKIKSFS